LYCGSRDEQAARQLIEAHGLWTFRIRERDAGSSQRQYDALRPKLPAWAIDAIRDNLNIQAVSWFTGRLLRRRRCIVADANSIAFLASSAVHKKDFIVPIPGMRSCGYVR
jgi:hypothetical protein